MQEGKTCAGHHVEGQRATGLPVAKLEAENEVEHRTDKAHECSDADKGKVDGFEDSVGEELEGSEVSEKLSPQAKQLTELARWARNS